MELGLPFENWQRWMLSLRKSSNKVRCSPSSWSRSKQLQFHLKVIPTVSIGFIGVNVSEMKPMTVVTADKNTVLPVEASD